MSKKSTSILMLSLLWLSSCTQGTDEPVPSPGGESGDTHRVEMTLSRAAGDDFAAVGIDKFTIYVYKIERKGTSLYKEQEVAVGQERFSLDLPLGDSYQTFAVAGNPTVTEKESFETIMLSIDPASDKEVWLSTPVRFTADRSVSSVGLTLRRTVARVEFEPAETEAELAAQTAFDRLDLTFNGISTTYRVSGGMGELTSFTATATADKGYKTGLYTFETSSLDQECTLDIIYYKGNEQVNTSAGTLETGIKFAANNRYTMSVPVTNPSFTARPMSVRSISAAVSAITVTKTAL